MIVREFHKIELEGPMDELPVVRELLDEHHWLITQQGPKRLGLNLRDPDRFFVSAQRDYQGTASGYSAQELSNFLENPGW